MRNIKRLLYLPWKRFFLRKSIYLIWSEIDVFFLSAENKRIAWDDINILMDAFFYFDRKKTVYVCALSILSF